MSFYWLVLGILSVWRITHLLYGENGPWNAFERLRESVDDGFWGRVVSCFYCLSVWVAVPFASLLGEGWLERLLLVPALSAGAILLERLTSRSQSIPIAHYVEDKEAKDVVSMREEDRIQRGSAGPTGN